MRPCQTLNYLRFIKYSSFKASNSAITSSESGATKANDPIESTCVMEGTCSISTDMVSKAWTVFCSQFLHSLGKYCFCRDDKIYIACLGWYNKNDLQLSGSMMHLEPKILTWSGYATSENITSTMPTSIARCFKCRKPIFQITFLFTVFSTSLWKKKGTKGVGKWTLTYSNMAKGSQKIACRAMTFFYEERVSYCKWRVGSMYEEE